MLDAHLVARLGTLDLDVELAVAHGESVALLGPNGAGKTTIVRAVAGLQPIDDGWVIVDDQVLSRPSTGTWVPPERRSVGVVFQDHLLFARMTAVDNVAFGLRARGVDRRTADVDARDVLERFGLADIADERPAALSGGQAQRVSLARALAPEPRVLLLDEPLAALDVTTRAAVRTELRRRLSGFDGVQVLVTHDPIDALVLADRLVIIEEGRVAQVGTPSEITTRPASRYVADLVGLNLLRGRTVADRLVRLDTGGEIAIADRAPTGDVAITIRPHAVALHRREPEGSPRNAWQATVADVETAGERVRVSLAGPVPVVAEITASSSADLALRPGVEIWASVKAVDVAIFER